LDLDQTFSHWEENGIGTNVASYIGHGTVRRRIMGMRNDAPTLEELNQMRLLVRRGMEAGALGLSSGLYYAPASYSKTEEVIALAKETQPYGGIYDVHLRDESTYSIGLVNAVKETIEIAGAAGIPGHIAHIKCLGVDVWGQSDSITTIVEEARNNGVRITADQYPYAASGSSITGALIPRWYLADHLDSKPPTFDPIQEEKVLREIKENIRKRGGPTSLLLTFPSKKNKPYQGKNLGEVAEIMNLEPNKAALALYKNGGSNVGSFNMNEADIKHFMQQSWVMTSSDGSTGHPRKYGSFPRKIHRYVQKDKVLPLKQMIHQSTGLTAETFNLTKRGLIKPGYYADIIVFNLEEIKDRADFVDPTQYAEGIHHVILNGQHVIKAGRFQEKLAGKVLRRSKK